MHNFSRFLFLIFISISILSCENNKCEDFLCNSGPAIFQLELVDKESGENLFTNETYKKTDLEINMTSGTGGESRFIDENNYNIIQLSTFESVDYSVKLSGSEIFTVSIDAEGVTKDCCFHTQVNDFKIENAENQLDTSTGIYKVEL